MQSTIQRECQLKADIPWAIKNYDKRWDDGSYKYYLVPIRRIVIPQLLDIYVQWQVITNEQKEALITQLVSPDRENWYIAFLTIRFLKPYKTKKNHGKNKK